MKTAVFPLPTRKVSQSIGKIVDSDLVCSRQAPLKETKSATMNIFRFFFLNFLFKSFVKVELSYVFTINLFTVAENCTEK